MRAKINIDTMSKINDFVNICSNIDCRVDLIDGSGYCVNGKSLIGAIATTDWSQVFVECSQDIYMKIKDFIVEQDIYDEN